VPEPCGGLAGDHPSALPAPPVRLPHLLGTIYLACATAKIRRKGNQVTPSAPAG
jgi:hypothetical protein